MTSRSRVEFRPFRSLVHNPAHAVGAWRWYSNDPTHVVYVDARRVGMMHTRRSSCKQALADCPSKYVFVPDARGMRNLHAPTLDAMRAAVGEAYPEA